MAYCASFEHDVFLSYARVDNLAPGQVSGWIDMFFDNLQCSLARKAGGFDKVRIWRDTRQIEGNQKFDQTIEDALNSSATILSLVSPGYLNSEWCLKELNHFYNKSKADHIGADAGDRNRVIFVRLDKLDRATLPKELGRCTGFDAFDKEEAAMHVDPYVPTHAAYSELIKSLSNAVLATLNDINEKHVVTPAKEEKADYSIFFADVNDSLARLKYKMVNQLRKKGYEVIDSVPPPLENDAHNEVVAKELEKVDLSIHLIDENPGKFIVDLDDLISYPQRQIEKAFTCSKNQLIWTPAEFNINRITEPDYRSFVHDMETNKGRNFQLIKGRSSTLEHDIDDLIASIKAQEIENISSVAQHVLLDTHFKDQLMALDINAKLIAQNIHSYLNPQADDPRSNLNLLGEMIKQVNKIVFIYGQISKEWILNRMSAALQLIVSHNLPVEDFVVLMVPPEKSPDDIQLRQRFMSVKVINNSNSATIRPESLEQMLSVLP